MFKNYFLVACRNMLRNRMYSIINIAGLSIALTCIVFILLYIKDEKSYDTFFTDADKIFQVNLSGNMGGNEFLGAGTPPPAGAALKNSFSEVETFTRVYNPGTTVIRSADEPTVKFFSEQDILAVDSNFLEVFDYPIAFGNAKLSLASPKSIVITSDIAKKYFGTENAVNKTMLIGNENKPFNVTAVLENITGQSTLHFDILLPVSAYPAVKQFSWSWVWLQVTTFVKMRDDFICNQKNLATLEKKFPAMIETQAASAFNRIGKPYKEFIRSGGRWELQLQPLKDVHLHSGNIGTRYSTLGDIKYIYIFSAIAIFILLLACVNFMNLSTAQSNRRGKEVGIRKVLGSNRSSLVRQFICESVLYSITGFVIMIFLVMTLMNPFNMIAGKNLSIFSLLGTPVIFYALCIAIFTGLLAGIYPAYYLTAFNPAEVLKASTDRSSIRSYLIRNGLVVIQFTISTVMIICTIIVYDQLKYAQSTDLGMNKNNVIVLAGANRLGSQETSLLNEIRNDPNVIDASITTSIPTKDVFGDGYSPQSSQSDVPLLTDVQINSFMVDENFIPTLSIRMKSGRNFTSGKNDSLSVIINETAARQIGWKNPIGKMMIYPGHNNQPFTVIGITEDFSTQSLHSPMGPFALFHNSSSTYQLDKSFILIKSKPGKEHNALNVIQSKWKKFAPAIPFDYSFLDEEFASQYKSEERLGKVFGLFTVLSFFIACLGLFGLSSFTAERRSKEVSIRKTLGATITGIVAMLSKDFLKPVLLSVFIAFPVAWYAMNSWLNDFAYRTTIHWQTFILSAASGIVIALFTVGYHAIRSAISNPVKNLRND